MPKDTGTTAQPQGTPPSVNSAAPTAAKPPPNTLREMCGPTWTEISDDLKHSADMWDILEVRCERENDGLTEVRRELEKIKHILEQNKF